MMIVYPHSPLIQVCGFLTDTKQKKGVDPDKRLQYRQQQSKGLVEELFSGFRKAYGPPPKKTV